MNDKYINVNGIEYLNNSYVDEFRNKITELKEEVIKLKKELNVYKPNDNCSPYRETDNEYKDDNGNKVYAIQVINGTLFTVKLFCDNRFDFNEFPFKLVTHLGIKQVDFGDWIVKYPGSKNLYCYDEKTFNKNYFKIKIEIK